MNDSFVPDNVSLWIVNYKRYDSLVATIKGWVNSFDFQEINIISNHSSLTQDKIPDIYRNRVKVWSNIFRQDWQCGSIAWCWNQAMLHTFETKDWCVMSQDDVIVNPGWVDCITSTDYMFYVVPHGDVCQFQSIRGWQKIGWFDEMFRSIGGPEADYLLRAIDSFPDQISVYDDHIWKMRHNLCGLENFIWNSPKFGELQQTRTEGNERFADNECFQRWNDKYGCHVDELFLNKKYHMAQNSTWPNIDWYPSFTQYLKDIGRI